MLLRAWKVLYGDEGQTGRVQTARWPSSKTESPGPRSDQPRGDTARARGAGSGTRSAPARRFMVSRRRPLISIEWTAKQLVVVTSAPPSAVWPSIQGITQVHRPLGRCEPGSSRPPCIDRERSTGRRYRATRERPVVAWRLWRGRNPPWRFSFDRPGEPLPTSWLDTARLVWKRVQDIRRRPSHEVK